MRKGLRTMSGRSVSDAAKKRWGRMAHTPPYAAYGREMYALGAVAGHRATAALVPLVLPLGMLYGMIVVHLSYALPEHFLSGLIVAAMAGVPWLAVQRWAPPLIDRFTARLL